MTNEIIVPVQVVYLLLILMFGVVMYFVYLFLFFYLYYFTKNPQLKYIFWLVFESLWKLIPKSWKKVAQDQVKKK
jgi:hypothetical protein